MTFDERYDSLISKYDSAEVDDVIRAICVADDLYGSNEKALDYHKFVEKSLPAVQMKRVKCDTVIVLSESKETYCNPESVRVYHGKSAGYADDTTCENLMIKLFSASKDYSKLIELCDKIDDTVKPITDELQSGSILVPIERDAGYYKTAFDSEDDDVLYQACLQCSKLTKKYLDKAYEHGTLAGTTRLNSVRRLLDGARIPIFIDDFTACDKVHRDFQERIFVKANKGSESFDMLDSLVYLIKFWSSGELIAESFGLKCENGKIAFKEGKSNG